MKKKYEKPLVAVDHYKLSQSIAGCAYKVNNMDSACYLRDPDVPAVIKSFAASNWFTAEGNCVIQAKAGQTYDGICYHTQVNGVNGS